MPDTNCMRTTVCHRIDTYKNFVNNNPVLRRGELAIVTDLPWYLSWFCLKPTRLKVGIERTFKETPFI